MAGNSYEEMQNENRVLRAENEALKRELDDMHKRWKVCDENRQKAEDECRALRSELITLRAKMDVVNLIFGGRR